MMNLHLWPFVVVVACWAVAVLILVDVIRIGT